MSSWYEYSEITIFIILYIFIIHPIYVMRGLFRVYVYYNGIFFSLPTGSLFSSIFLGYDGLEARREDDSTSINPNYTFKSGK